ncbi:MAG TPA: hypothetical protein VE959_28090 [Bryobacteraceae bacterium]|nr:hypothetical protein [Bryobacteraceae bacterium]
MVEFLREFDEYERNFDSPDPAKRLPNFMVMSLPENHTVGMSPRRFTPNAIGGQQLRRRHDRGPRSRREICSGRERVAPQSHARLRRYFGCPADG